MGLYTEMRLVIESGNNILNINEKTLVYSRRRYYMKNVLVIGAHFDDAELAA